MTSDTPSSIAPARVSGGRILVAALHRQGVRRIYCVPGESYLPVLDALHDVPDIAVVSARHEGAAANMAEADGKLTARPGICFVTRGPGATHASIGVHTAFQDSTPMILFIGQVAREARDREGFQEVDYRAMFAPLAKWVAEVDQPERIAEYVARAYRVAQSGRPGPVVLSLPEGTLSDTAAVDVHASLITGAATAPSARDLAAFVDLLQRAERPLFVVGGSGLNASSRERLTEFAQRNELPLVASFRRQDIIDNRSERYCGHLGLGIDPQLAQRVQSADVIVALGSRLGENTTNGYTLLRPPMSQQTLIHIHPDPNELGRVFQPTLAIASRPAEFVDALAPLQIEGRQRRTSWCRDARADYVKFSTPAATSAANHVDLASVVGWLNEHLNADAILANGAGNYTLWVHRYFRYRQPRTQLAPTSGAMGYGVPAAIAAKLRYPERQVVAVAGDGCFLMYAQELATAVQHGANVVVLVVNNGSYGTIRMHQERRFPGRVVATDLVNPDFVKLAQSYGAYAERVETTAAFGPAFERAVAAHLPALLELRVDPLQSTPTFRL